MLRRPIHDEVMGLASRLAQECHPQVALQHAEARARMRADVSMRRSGVLSGRAPHYPWRCLRCARHATFTAESLYDSRSDLEVCAVLGGGGDVVACPVGSD